jgi:hypothetical protein
MNYLQKLINGLNLEGVYYTPEKIKKKIEKIKINSIIGNPPFKY